VLGSRKYYRIILQGISFPPQGRARIMVGALGAMSAGFVRSVSAGTLDPWEPAFVQLPAHEDDSLSGASTPPMIFLTGYPDQDSKSGGPWRPEEALKADCEDMQSLFTLTTRSEAQHPKLPEHQLEQEDQNASALRIVEMIMRLPLTPQPSSDVGLSRGRVQASPPRVLRSACPPQTRIKEREGHAAASKALWVRRPGAIRQPTARVPGTGGPGPDAPPVVSVGSLGHPAECAEACPYVKRKTGCKMGMDCSKCHLCFWQRPVVKQQQYGCAPGLHSQSVPAPPSPQATAATTVPSPPPPPPKHWQAREPQGAARAELEAKRVTPVDGVPSVGSIGHPTKCGSGCKYNSKGKGCKDGSLCVRCHLCVWRRQPGRR